MGDVHIHLFSISIIININANHSLPRDNLVQAYQIYFGIIRPA